MKTITPFELQMLIDNSHVELIDVRPKKDFLKNHALIARSIPLENMEPHSVLEHCHGDRHAPVYIMGERQADTSLAVCALASAGLSEPVVVEGGENAWENQGLPTVHERSFRIPSREVPTVILAGIAALFLGVLPYQAFAFAALCALLVALPHVLRRSRRLTSAS